MEHLKKICQNKARISSSNCCNTIQSRTAQPTDTTTVSCPVFSYSTMTSLARGKLIAVIGDEDTCVGFLLGGIGELNRARQPNFLVVDKNVSVQEIENTFKSFVSRDDVAIILINQHIAEMIRYAIDDHVKSIPAVLEIPSKEHPYDPSKDSILFRAKGMFSTDDFR
ncbi:putative V-type proton ATPase subunit F [Trichinella patagoniensis]|uniref:Putative V-type proton ATPase subunit F n=1 Tax=Trichinella patagoniensis TaxID=990121 RepID=A0A0V1AE59_9BILA|nr:putative V-type proton ATPase subunit F [Trichinella patagoniensis]